MPTLGEVLRAAREEKGASLVDAERGTRIRQKYLAALEDDNTAALPGPVYARGFVRNYALYLGIDVAEAIRLFDDASQPTRDRIKVARGGQPKPPPRPDQERISIQPLSQERIDTRVRYGSQYIALSLLAIPLLIVFYFIYSAYAGPQSQPAPTPQVSQRQPTTTGVIAAASITALASDPNAGGFNTPTVFVPPTMTALVAQSTVTGTNPITTSASVTSTVAIPVGADVTVRVVISGHESWMRVLVDGVQQFAGTLPIGASREWKGRNTIQLRVGRADSVRVYVNGADRGFMGTPDNLIVEKKWDKSGKEQVVQP